MANSSDKVDVENVNTPGRTVRLDRAKYENMREAILKTLTHQSPGMTAAEALEAVQPLLDQEMFPQGEKSGWWFKSVQLDLEAKGLVAREKTKPMRLHLSD